MVPYTRNMRQEATYWPYVGPDQFGNPSYGPGELIRCRWQHVASLFRDVSGREVTSAAVVYTDRPLGVQGRLALGSRVGDTPEGGAGAYEIRQVGSSPDLRQTTVLHKVWLG